MKILVLTDSRGNPRYFGKNDSDIVEYKDTFPALLKSYFNKYDFYQLSFGNITTEELTSQIIGYFQGWSPDFIIILSGINDCRPEAFTELEKKILKFLTFSFSRRLKFLTYNPKIIKLRQKKRVSLSKFKKIVNNFSLAFLSSKILWLEISASYEYEKIRPGFIKNREKFSIFLEDTFKDNHVKIFLDLNKEKCFHSDNLHFNKKGHQLIAEKIKKIIIKN